MFNIRAACASALLLAVTSASVIAQTVITGTTSTSGTCDGGPRSVPPIGLCKSGSYILGADITSSTTNVIDIAGDNITLDLNGFSISGAQANCTAGAVRGNSCTSAQGSLYGINIVGNNAVVKNGTVRNINGTGIYAGATAYLSDIRAHDNNGDGVLAVYGQLRNINSTNNNGVGVSLGRGLVDAVYASYNNSYGIEGSDYNVLISNSTAQSNAISGVYVLAGQTNNVTSYLNGSDGFQTGSLGQFINSFAYANVSDGFYAAGGGAAGAIIQSLSSLNGGYGFNLSSSSCYNDITTVSNTTGMVNGGAAYGTGTICAH
jgi:hypothetical protein